MCSAIPPIAGIPGRGGRKLVVWLERCYSRSSEKIRTPSKLQRKLLRSPFSFQNCTKTAKYEALEKNVVSNHKLPSRRQSLVRSFSYKSLSLLGILRPIDRV